MPDYADLHLHTNHSDGALSPRKVVERAAAIGLMAVAITDHDTVSGLEDAELAGKVYEVEVLPGVEISAVYGQIELHIVGLGVDRSDARLTEALAESMQARSERVDRILAKLQAAGVPLTRSEVEAHAVRGTALGRMHIALALRERGYTTSVQEGFDRFIKHGRKAFVPKAAMSCAKAIDLIHGAGGLAFVGHPGVGAAVQSVLPRVIAMPFDGIEVYHSKHTPGHVTQFTQIALERDLLISGGSDYHGGIKEEGNDVELGSVRLPYHHVARIKDALRKRGTRIYLSGN